MTSDGTPWSRGRIDRRADAAQLLFGEMHEDPEIELAAFPSGARVFCIASAGCTAFALAQRGFDVTAVDVNPAQVAYVEARLRGEPLRLGVVDRLLARTRSAAPVVGWSKEKLRRFCDLDDTERQEAFWRRELDTRRFRAFLAALFSPSVLRRVYAREFVRVLPPAFDRVLRSRLERGWRLHRNRGNPYARQLLLGEPVAVAPASVRVLLADAAAYLERAARGGFDAFALSNILDGTGPDYEQRLMRAVRSAAAPNAVAVIRTLGEATSVEEADCAARDRSLLWGGVKVTTVA